MQQASVMHEYYSNSLFIFGMPVSITVYTVITSLSPLRAYVHEKGAVRFRQDFPENLKKVRLSSRSDPIESLYLVITSPIIR